MYVCYVYFNKDQSINQLTHAAGCQMVTPLLFAHASSYGLPSPHQ